MGNTIPHGDRLHECSATCPEYKNGPMPGKVINHRHDDGRNCILGPDGEWRHYDHPTPEPGPRERVEYKCLRAHPQGEALMVDLSSDPPSPLRPIIHNHECDDSCPPNAVDRGEYEHPSDGKVCKLIGGEWKSLSGAGRGYTPCVRQHSDRGEFGMPGLGIGRIMEMPRQAGKNSRLPDYTMVVSSIGVSFDFGEQGVDEDFMTEEAKVIFDALPSLLLDFLASNAKYARAQTHDLGLKGVIPDVNRKTSALITRIWDGVEAGRDPTDELIGDLIGHLLLMLGKYKMETGGGTPG